MIERLKFKIDDLVNEILDILPESLFEREDTTFLDVSMGGGQFVRIIEERLRSHGHSDENISNRVFGYENNKLAVQYATNVHGLVGTYKAISNNKLFNKKTIKKHNVVVGNPPYANDNPKASNGKKWPRFVELAVEHTKRGGYTSLVVPNSWTKGSISTKGSGILWEYLNQYDMIHINNHDCGKHFDRGVAFSYFVLSKTKPKGNGILVQNRKQYQVPFHTLSMLPKEPMAIDIVNQFFQSDNTIEHTLVTNTRNKTMGIVEDGKYPVFSNGKILHTNSEKYDQEEKVLIPWSNTYEKHIQVGNMIAGDNSIYLYTNGNGDGIISVLTSKLYIFCLHQTRMAAHNEPVRKFPALDFTRVWTNSEIYEYFGLDQKQAKYIDKSVKIK